MASGRDRPYYCGKHMRHGVNVQVLADPAGRLVWASAALPGACHDMGAVRDHGLFDALTDSGVQVIADSGYRGSGFTVPQRRRRTDPETGGGSPATSARSTPPTLANADRGERANAQLKSWKILRKIRCCPLQATRLVKALLASSSLADAKWNGLTAVPFDADGYLYPLRRPQDQAEEVEHPRLRPRRRRVHRLGRSRPPRGSARR